MQDRMELREEARRCLESLKTISDGNLRRQMAVRSFMLIQEAEALNQAGGDMAGKAIAARG
ncbi:MAG: hypothetical protein QOK29_3280 [Rhodospirillaceae bacterium]|jgi:hypothetical protein|nr:hypothetical protein [Rhodospirillaceae bacterium]